MLWGLDPDEAIATTVAYAFALGKTPIVVNDCAGFLVNRILFPYFGGLAALINDGVDFKRIDKVMEKFGWPMGPAYLGDVVGLDTAVHAGKVMADAYPDRMAFSDDNAMGVMADVRVGEHGTNDAHVHAGNRGERVSWLLETVQAGSDGFFALNAEAGNDTVNAATSTLPLTPRTMRMSEWRAPSRWALPTSSGSDSTGMKSVSVTTPEGVVKVVSSTLVPGR